MNDHDFLAYYFKVGTISGLTKEQAKLFAAGMLRDKHNINHLTIK